MVDFYNMNAAKGTAVGQGLMGAGQIFSGAIEKQKEEKEKTQEKNLTKALTLVNLYTKMGDDLSPEQRSKLYTGALLPMLAKAGAIPEGTDSQKVSQFIGSLSVSDKEKMQGLREDNDEVIDLIDKGEWKDAEKFLNGMAAEYKGFPGATEFIKRSKELLKTEKAYSRGKTETKEAETRKSKKEVQAGVLAGEYEVVPEGEEEKYTGRPVVKDYAGTGLMVAGQSEAQKTQSAIDRAKAVKQAEIAIEQSAGLSQAEKERAALNLQSQKELYQFKQNLENNKGIQITDAQMLNAFEEAETALSKRAMTDTSINKMTEEEKTAWKVDWVTQNIENIKTIKGGVSQQESSQDMNNFRIMRNKKTGEQRIVYPDGTSEPLNTEAQITPAGGQQGQGTAEQGGAGLMGGSSMKVMGYDKDGNTIVYNPETKETGTYINSVFKARPDIKQIYKNPPK